MKLENYQNPKISKIENLVNFFDDNVKWQEDYIENCEDFLNNYLEYACESEIYLGELDFELRTIVNYLIENNQTDLIYDSCSGEHTKGVYRRSNEIYSANFGEIEVQLTGLSDKNCNCIYSEITKNMSLEDIKSAENLSGHCIYNECIYLDYSSYERASLILDEDLLIKELLK